MLNLYPLPYPEDALRPWISEETMNVHYNKHYKGYYDKTIEELQRYGIDATLEEIIEQNLYEKSQKLQDNFGGFYNHSIFWYMLQPEEMTPSNPKSQSARLIERDFGSLSNFKSKFDDIAKSRFGSGWAWWVMNPRTGKTEIMSTPNQDFPEMDKYGRKVPLLGVDVWEHAYYLDYKNQRGEYVKNILDNIVDWNYIETRVNDAIRLSGLR